MPHSIKASHDKCEKRYRERTLLPLSTINPMLNSPEIAAQFADTQCIDYMLQVEMALAKVQEKLGIIPQGTADAVAEGIAALDVDRARLHESLEKNGVPTVDLIQQLREQLGNDAASYLHWGATTQDIMDTALVLQLRSVLRVLQSQLERLMLQLAQRADAHRTTLMVGRTHSQQALPIVFGYKVANWVSSLLRHHQRLDELKRRLLVVQFGGAAGTLASLGTDGLRVRDGLAVELGLGTALSTWHTQRDNLAECAGWLSMLTGSLAKMAQDIILMAQSEITEVYETDDPTRGGSSTMPQKRNPVASEAIIAAARTNATLLSNMHHAMIQEHERATGAWQTEWLTLPQMAILAGAALRHALFLSENLVVNVARMAANVQAANGLILAEAIDLALAPYIGRTQAKQIIQSAVQVVLESGRHLVDVVREQVNVAFDWAQLKDERHYLGSAEVFIDTILQEVERITHD